MNIQLNTDKNISGNENLEKFVSQKLKGSLKHMVNHITRIEVHLSDQNADKSGPDDIQCKIEARLQNRQPVMVSSQSESKEVAISEATEKLKSMLSSIIGKMQNK